MPRGIFKNGNKGQFKKGMISLTKGKKFSYKSRPNAIGRKAWNTGKKLSPEHIEKLKGKRPNVISWNKGTKGICKANKTSFKARENKGENNKKWKGGITKENDMIRHSIEGTLWRNSVFARDGYTCQISGVKGCNLVAHHIQNFAQYPELRFAINNGFTMTKELHLKFHKIYGKKNNTKEQLVEFAQDFLIGQNA